MIDYSTYWSSSKTFEQTQETVSFAPIVLSKKLWFLSVVFLVLILANMVLAVEMSMINYNLDKQQKIMKNLQIQKMALLHQTDYAYASQIILQKAKRLGLKPVNTKNIRFFK